MHISDNYSDGKSILFVVMMHNELHLIQHRSPAELFLNQDRNKWMLSRDVESIFIASIM